MGSGDIIKIELIKVNVALLQLIDMDIFSIYLKLTTGHSELPMRFGGAILRNQLTHFIEHLACAQFFASTLVNVKKKKKKKV